jgi:hypothetical protein
MIRNYTALRSSDVYARHRCISLFSYALARLCPAPAFVKRVSVLRLHFTRIPGSVAETSLLCSPPFDLANCTAYLSLCIAKRITIFLVILEFYLQYNHRV